jgi:hypothetical protein
LSKAVRKNSVGRFLWKTIVIANESLQSGGQVMTTIDPTPPQEIARHELCRKLAEVIRNGESVLQIRFLDASPETHDVWVYVRDHHDWKKRDDLAFPPGLHDGLLDLLEGLVHQKFSDDWSCARHEHHQRVDFVLNFAREALEKHLSNGLESYLNGCLAHSHHDSGQDSRRRIRFQQR